MKKLTILVVAILLITSCGKRYCERKYPPQTNIEYKYIEKIKLDTILHIIKGDSIFIEHPVDCPDQQIIYRDGAKETKIVIKDRVMRFNYTTKDDSIRIATYAISQMEVNSKKEIIHVKYIPKWGKLAIGASLLIILIALIYFSSPLIRFIKKAIDFTK